MTPKRYLLALTMVLVLAVAGTGCGGDSPSSGADGSTGPVSSGNGGAGSDVGNGDVPASEATTPEETVLQLWKYLQIGALPQAVAEYSDSARRSVGIGNLLGALGIVQRQAGILEPEITASLKQPGGLRFVAIRASSKPDPSGEHESLVKRYSFTLRRASGGAWRITYDSLVESGVPAFLAERGQGDAADRETADLLARYRIAAIRALDDARNSPAP